MKIVDKQSITKRPPNMEFQNPLQEFFRLL